MVTIIRHVARFIWYTITRRKQDEFVDGTPIKETRNLGLFKTGKARLGGRLFNILFIVYIGFKRRLDSSDRQYISVSEKVRFYLWKFDLFLSSIGDILHVPDDKSN